MIEQDSLRRFLFEELSIRGEWVRLHQSWNDSKQFQNLSEVAEEQLGQALAAVVLLSASIKFDGSLILQAQGDGAIKTIVAQSTHDQKIRGLLRGSTNNLKSSFSELIGKGRLVITVENNIGEPYQGVTPLEGNSLADVITTYFLQSEQLETKVWLFANGTDIAGLFLQQLPGNENDQSDWERIVMLANTVSKEEMLTLESETMLYRLFNEEKVRLFEHKPVEFKCGCSQQKIENTLATLGRKELESILQERDKIEVDCEFCGRQYGFDAVDVENLLKGQPLVSQSKTLH